MKSSQNLFLPKQLLGFVGASASVRKDFLTWISEGLYSATPFPAPPRVSDRLLDDIATHNVEYLTIFDDHYPQQLLALADPPIVIFYRGNVSLIQQGNFEKTVSIIGSRHATGEALRITFESGKSAAENGLTVISGLALGADGQAHRGAIASDCGKCTVAVVAQCVTQCYPTSHQDLYDRILDSGGVVISEYPPHTPLFKGNFLMRNRIIAALSRMTIVTQAKVRSGALVTARLANEIGREVGAFPWPLSVGAGAGTNRLIRDGAHCLLSIDDILSFFEGITIKAKPENGGTDKKLSPAQKKAMNMLRERGEIFIDDLKIHSGIDATDVCELEISGCIRVDHAGFVDLV